MMVGPCGVFQFSLKLASSARRTSEYRSDEGLRPSLISRTLWVISCWMSLA